MDHPPQGPQDAETMAAELKLEVARREQAEQALAAANEALRDLEVRFRQSQKMEAVGRLAGGIAHDFNNLLTAIIGHTDLAARDAAPDSPVRDELNEIQNAAARAAALTHQLLAFSRKQDLEFQAVSLNQVVSGITGLLRRLIGEDIALVTRLDPELGTIQADPGQLEQVIINLAVNARDAMPEGGHLTVETANLEVNGEPISQTGVPSGRYIMLAVSDTGIGMSPYVQSHIFEPFFTTKDIGKGTGLGLATVYGIVSQCGGYITVYSEPGAGSAFKVYLPRVSDETGAPLEPLPEQEAIRGTETVLLVEDSDMVRQLARRVLEEHGYRVLAARDGEEAMSIAAEFRENIDLLLTDVVMPGLSGRRVVERLAPSRPRMRILYMSGYTDSTVAMQRIIDDGAAFIQKPFTPTGLARRVRELLDSPASVG